MSFFVLFILCLFVFNLNLTLMSIFLLLLVAFLVLLERKVLGLLQERKGPNMVSVFGLVQTIVDGVKLLVKYCYINYLSFYFLLLPIISLSLSYMHWLVLPLPFELFGSSFTIIFTFVVMGLMVYVILGCGFVSSSSYSIISAIRSVAQMISYEVVFMFYLLTLSLLTAYLYAVLGNPRFSYCSFGLAVVSAFTSLLLVLCDLSLSFFWFWGSKMLKPKVFDPQEVASIFMDLPDDGETSDDPDFSGNEGVLDEIALSASAVHAFSVHVVATTGGGGTPNPQGSQGGEDSGVKTILMLTLMLHTTQQGIHQEMMIMGLLDPQTVYLIQ